MEIRLANPRGFCAGVDRAIEIVERALELFGAPVYVRHEIVHNRLVVRDLRAKGAVFVDELEEVPAGAVVIFSAHGVSPTIKQEAAERQLHALDATCPLVTKVHMEVLRFCQEGHTVILIGHAHHPEVEGTLGHGLAAGQMLHLVESVADVERLPIPPETNIAYVTQTTLSVSDTEEIVAALRRRYPHITEPAHSDICYATQNRQDAVRELAKGCDPILVVGSSNSSNSNRLVEIAQQAGASAHLIDGPDEIRSEWLSDREVIGVTAGASAPEELVQKVVAHLHTHYGGEPREVEGRTERITFSLPHPLRKAARPSVSSTGPSAP